MYTRGIVLQAHDVLWLLIWGDEAFSSLMSNLNAGIHSCVWEANAEPSHCYEVLKPIGLAFFCFSPFYWLKATLVSETDPVMPFSLPTFPTFTIPCIVLPPFLYLMLCCCFLSHSLPPAVSSPCFSCFILSFSMPQRHKHHFRRL